jgi:hypothetical protein
MTEREWKPHLDYAGEPMLEGEFRDPPESHREPVGFDERLFVAFFNSYWREGNTHRGSWLYKVWWRSILLLTDIKHWVVGRPN